MRGQQIMQHHTCWIMLWSICSEGASGPLWFQRIHLDRQQLHARRLRDPSLDLLPYNLQPGLLENTLELAILPIIRESARVGGERFKRKEKKEKSP